MCGDDGTQSACGKGDSLGWEQLGQDRVTGQRVTESEARYWIAGFHDQ